jgi:hypothetical protein
MSVAESASGVAESLGLLRSTENHQQADRRTLADFMLQIRAQGVT